jgi:hypothetical protein
MPRMINLTPQGIANGEGAKKSTIKKKLKVGPISLNFVTIIIIALVTLFYLAQTQIGTAKKSQISELSKQKQELGREIEQLEVEAAKGRSIINIKKDAASFGMIPIQNIIYIFEKP